MSQENVELIRRAYEGFDTDLDALLWPLIQRLSGSVRVIRLEPGHRRGHSGVRDAFAANRNGVGIAPDSTRRRTSPTRATRCS